MIRKITILSLAIFLFSKAHSQLIKGTYLLGGNASFSHEKNGGNKYTSFDINPKVGLFIKNRFAVGLTGDVSGYTSKNPYGKYTSNGYGIGPFARYYFLPEGNKVNLLAEANAMYLRSTNNTTSSSNTFAYGVLAGPSIFLNESIGLEFLLGYRNSKMTGTSNVGRWGLNVGFQIHFNKGNKK